MAFLLFLGVEIIIGAWVSMLICGSRHVTTEWGTPAALQLLRQ